MARFELKNESDERDDNAVQPSLCSFKAVDPGSELRSIFLIHFFLIKLAPNNLLLKKSCWLRDSNWGPLNGVTTALVTRPALELIRSQTEYNF